MASKCTLHTTSYLQASQSSSDIINRSAVYCSARHTHASNLVSIVSSISSLEQNARQRSNALSLLLHLVVHAQILRTAATTWTACTKEGQFPRASSAICSGIGLQLRAAGSEPAQCPAAAALDGLSNRCSLDWLYAPRLRRIRSWNPEPTLHHISRMLLVDVVHVIELLHPVGRKPPHDGACCSCSEQAKGQRGVGRGAAAEYGR